MIVKILLSEYTCISPVTKFRFLMPCHRPPCKPRSFRAAAGQVWMFSCSAAGKAI